MATSKIKNTTQVIISEGTYNIGPTICSGFNTGSGNYCDFFLPIIYDISKTYTVTFDNISCMFGDTRLNLSSSQTEIVIIDKAKTGLYLEIQYPSTQTMSVLANVYITGLKITCS